MTLQSTVLLPFHVCFLYFHTPMEQNLKRKTGRQPQYPSAKEASPFLTFCTACSDIAPRWDGFSVCVSAHLEASL